MSWRVEIRLNSSLINPYLARVTDMSAKRAADKTAARANANVRAKDRVRTGALASSYVSKRVPSNEAHSSSYVVGSPLFYAIFQEKGIGPVHASPGKVLRFKPKGSSVFIFRKSTKGFKGANQLADAYKDLRLEDYLP